MPKAMSLGSCTCEGWANSAQDLSDRIVSATATGMNVYDGPMFDFCPYCGRKLVVAGAGLEKLGTWKGKPIQEYDNAGLIEIARMMGQYISWLKEEMTAQIEGMEKLLGGS